MESTNPPAWLDKAWESTCRVLLGRDIGRIGRYEEYLQRGVPAYEVEKSSISGREVVVSGGYGKGAKFICGDEIGKYQEALKAVPLDMNDIKDIDSIARALGENVRYCGNIVLGNSSNATLANRLIDSNFVYKSQEVFYSKYIAHCCIVKYSEYAFGGESVGKGAHFSIKGFEIYEASRVMESVHVYSSSDCTYCTNVENCFDCLFCFNLRSKRKCIGNLELEAEKFAALKAKLQAEIAGELERKGRVLGILEIIGG